MLNRSVRLLSFVLVAGCPQDTESLSPVDSGRTANDRNTPPLDTSGPAATGDTAGAWPALATVTVTMPEVPNAELHALMVANPDGTFSSSHAIAAGETVTLKAPVGAAITGVMRDDYQTWLFTRMDVQDGEGITLPFRTFGARPVIGQYRVSVSDVGLSVSEVLLRTSCSGWTFFTLPYEDAFDVRQYCTNRDGAVSAYAAAQLTEGGTQVAFDRDATFSPSSQAAVASLSNWTEEVGEVQTTWLNTDGADRDLFLRLELARKGEVLALDASPVNGGSGATATITLPSRDDFFDRAVASLEDVSAGTRRIEVRDELPANDGSVLGIPLTTADLVEPADEVTFSTSPLGATITWSDRRCGSTAFDWLYGEAVGADGDGARIYWTMAGPRADELRAPELDPVTQKELWTKLELTSYEVRLMATSRSWEELRGSDDLAVFLSRVSDGVTIFGPGSNCSFEVRGL